MFIGTQQHSPTLHTISVVEVIRDVARFNLMRFTHGVSTVNSLHIVILLSIIKVTECVYLLHVSEIDLMQYMLYRFEFSCSITLPFCFWVLVVVFACFLCYSSFARSILCFTACL
jgi:hypothetical protein